MNREVILLLNMEIKAKDFQISKRDKLKMSKTKSGYDAKKESLQPERICIKKRKEKSFNVIKGQMSE